MRKSSGSRILAGTGQEQLRFQKTVWDHYRARGRHDLPWRLTCDPYRIAVSEIMLQQTQVARVIPKYTAFVKVFPTITALAAAPINEVLKHWQGLGYNRRALYLKKLATEITTEHQGNFPRGYRELLSLPGIGPYTAGAIAAFAFNEPVAIIETNIRTVFLRHFFQERTKVPDRHILPLVAATLPPDNPREWYYALMDYGAYLKVSEGNNAAQSLHYTRQSTFKGSNRQLRGVIIALATKKKKITNSLVQKSVAGFSVERIAAALEQLEAEGFLVKTKTSYRTAR